MKKIGIGILVYNPTDDKDHLERISNCIDSVETSCKKSELEYIIYILINKAGNNTKKWLSSFRKSTDIKKFYLWTLGKENSIAACYSWLQQYLKDRSDYICILGDDYVCDENWVKRMYECLNKTPDIDYLMPQTTFVPQMSLEVDIPKHIYKKYFPNIVYNKNDKGIISGITTDGINKLYEEEIKNSEFSGYEIFDYEWNSTNSVETTWFKKEVFDKVGYINDKYNNILFQWDFFRRVNKHFSGCVYPNGFIFHYGKGATKAVYKDKEDEKYEGSPAEKACLDDIALWNYTWCDALQKWW